jgi:hypothetical protein
MTYFYSLSLRVLFFHDAHGTVKRVFHGLYLCFTVRKFTVTTRAALMGGSSEVNSAVHAPNVIINY